MSVVQKRSSSPFPFMELDELAQIEVLRNLAPTDVKSARLTCSHVQELLDYEIGIKVVTPEFNWNVRQSSLNSAISEHKKTAQAIFDKKIRGLNLSFLTPHRRPPSTQVFLTLYQPNNLKSITVTGAQFQWLEILLTRCKNLRNFTYYTFRSRRLGVEPDPSHETRPIHEIIEGFKDSPYVLDKLESLTVKLTGESDDYVCPMFLLFGGINPANLRNLHVEIDMAKSLTADEEVEDELEAVTTTAQRKFAYICYGRAIEFLSKNRKLHSLKLSLTGEMEDEEMEGPLPIQVQALLNKLGSNKMKTRLVEIQNRNWERLRTLQEWVNDLPSGNLRKLSFNISQPGDVEFLTTLMERQTSLKTLKVYTEKTFLLHEIENVHKTILQAVLYPENMEELSISHYFQDALNFPATFENFKSLKSLKLRNCTVLGLCFIFLDNTPPAIPIYQLSDGCMTTQLSTTLSSLTKDFLMNLETIDLTNFWAPPLEMRQILELPMLRKIRLCAKRNTQFYKCFGIYSTDLVKAMLTMRKLEYIHVEPVIFRQDNSLKVEVTKLGSSGSIVVPNDVQFLKSVGKLILDRNEGCSVYNGKYTLSQRLK